MLKYVKAAAVLVATGLVIAGLAACTSPAHGDVRGARVSTYAADTDCQAAVPFLRGYDQVTATFDPRLDTARRELNAARNEASSRAALLRLAATLESYDAALGFLPAPPSDAALVEDVVSAGGRMAEQARLLAAQPAGSRDVGGFDAALEARTAATRTLALRATLLRSECQ